MIPNDHDLITQPSTVGAMLDREIPLAVEFDPDTLEPTDTDIAEYCRSR